MSKEKEIGADTRSKIAHADAMAARVFATHRQVTGPAYNHGYVYRGNKVVMACKHKHRTGDAAERCAEKMLRAYMRQSSSDTGVSR